MPHTDKITKALRLPLAAADLVRDWLDGLLDEIERRAYDYAYRDFR